MMSLKNDVDDVDKILKKRRYRGTVRWFGEDGWGFVASPDVDSEVYVRHSDIIGEGYRTLVMGEKVEFRLLRTPKGLMAKEVVVVMEK